MLTQHRKLPPSPAAGRSTACPIPRSPPSSHRVRRSNLRTSSSNHFQQAKPVPKYSNSGSETSSRFETPTAPNAFFEPPSNLVYLKREIHDIIFAAATDRIYIDAGHVVDFCNKSLRTSRPHRMGPWPAQVLTSLVRGMATARRSEELNSWRNPIDLVSLVWDARDALPKLWEQSASLRGHLDRPRQPPRNHPGRRSLHHDRINQRGDP